MSITKGFITAAVVGCLGGISAVNATEVQVTITNTANTTYQTPVWVGFHDGTFDSFDVGSGASAAIEAVAEDGNTGPLATSFVGAGNDTTLGGGPFAPGASVQGLFDLTLGTHNYLSFASMVLPSSDFFIGNDDPLAHSIASVLNGTINSLSFTIFEVYDAGTEINDFATSAGNPIFGIPGGQTGGNQGAAQNGVIAIASGTDFGLFLNATGVNTAAFDFTGVSLATITVSAVPLPAALPLMLAGLAGVGSLGRRRRRG